MSFLGHLGILATKHAIVTTIAVSGGAASLVTIGLVVGPPSVFSGSTTIVDSSGVQSAGLGSDRSDMVRALKRMITSTHAVINVHTTNDGAADLVLWMSDAHDPGVVNEDEILIVTYAPLLRTILALTIESQEGPALEVDSAVLFSDTLSADWRRRPDVEQAVIGTDVTGVAMEPIAKEMGELTLRIRLTFSSDHPDIKSERRAQAMFVITRPNVARMR